MTYENKDHYFIREANSLLDVSSNPIRPHINIHPNDKLIFKQKCLRVLLHILCSTKKRVLRAKAY
jgi:hypothetical protein